jgi:hypothetical protein
MGSKKTSWTASLFFHLQLRHRLLIPDRTLERDVKKFKKDRILTNLKVP